MNPSPSDQRRRRPLAQFSLRSLLGLMLATALLLGLLRWLDVPLSAGGALVVLAVVVVAAAAAVGLAVTLARWTGLGDGDHQAGESTEDRSRRDFPEPP